MTSILMVEVVQTGHLAVMVVVGVDPQGQRLMGTTGPVALEESQ